MVKNKKGWIPIVEALISILLLMSLVSVVIRGDQFKKDVDSGILEKQAEFLKEIGINQSLRNDVLSINSLPIYSNESGFPLLTKSFFDKNFEKDCLLKICWIDEPCELTFKTSGQIYSNDRIIHSNNTLHSPRRIKTFCYNL